MSASYDPSRAYAERLRRRFGHRVQRVVLFGSRSVGDHRPDSDYDVAVFMATFEDARKYWRIVADIAYEFVETGYGIHPAILHAGRLEDSDFMRHIRKYGTEL